ncbi:hypothetical protein [Pedobacter sp. MR2016-24]|uniref:hypothetical protein n=1 Tax=Pedobacter sp. MR2016-24 TaxID=2994466 RepID=UPI002245CB7C|nr:hypothetical protein [Pedobacter sp. MR2016-24]MCX2485927.1 hypothetical protein [Pedobacter sp. MR2016-24]
MGNQKFLMVLAFAGITLAACSGNKDSKEGADSSAYNSSVTDTVATDTGSVAPADSTHSFRNDRGTDSVGAGKGVPEKP